MFYSNYVKLCSKLNKSPSAVGEELGFTRASVTGWGNGATPRKSSLIKIADYFGVTVAELMAGVGEQEKAPATEGEGISCYETELMRLWRCLSPEQQARELAFLREEALKSGAEKDS